MNAVSEPERVWNAEVLQWVQWVPGMDSAAAVATPAGLEEEDCTHLAGTREGVAGRHMALKAGG